MKDPLKELKRLQRLVEKQKKPKKTKKTKKARKTKKMSKTIEQPKIEETIDESFRTMAGNDLQAYTHLVNLRDELYVGSWERMQQDLRDRLNGRPYIHKLVERIKDDLGRIYNIESFEIKYKVNAADITGRLA